MNTDATQADELDRHWKRKALTGEPEVTVNILTALPAWTESEDLHGPHHPLPFSKVRAWVERENFYGDLSGADRYLVMGFDTEFKPPAEPVTADEIALGYGKYEVLSYQLHCKLYDPARPDAVEWSAICYPNGRRLRLTELITFALWQGLSSKAISKAPTSIFLVGHFTRADIPALADHDEIFRHISAVRNTFTSVEGSVPITYAFETDADEDPISLRVTLRDTMLLTAASAKSLKAIGEMVGVPKVTLAADPAVEQYLKENMDFVLRETPALFEDYALTDAVICVRYFDQLATLTQQLLGEGKRLPVTLTGIGVELLQETWRQARLDPDQVLGMETIRERRFHKLWNRYVTKKVRVPEQLVVSPLDELDVPPDYSDPGQAFATRAVHAFVGPGKFLVFGEAEAALVIQRVRMLWGDAVKRAIRHPQH